MMALTISITLGIGGSVALLSSISLKLDGLLILLVALADSSFLAIPEGNDLLIVILSAGKPWSKMLSYIFLTT